MIIGRRQFSGLLAAAGFPAGPKKVDSTVGGVRIGVQTTSFRGLTLDQMPAAMRSIGLGYAELYQRHVEPARVSPEDLRKWRLSVPLERFREVRAKFENEGVEVLSYYFNLRDETSEEEMARAFQMASALGAKFIVSSSHITAVKRIGPHAVRAGMRVALHNHSYLKPNEIARPEDFQAALAGAPPEVGICLDAGHYVAANNDPLALMEQWKGRIFSVHLKDRKKDQGPDVPFGEGDTPVAEILRRLSKDRRDVPAVIEWEAKGKDSAAEVRQCFDYCRKVLTARS